VCSSDLWIIALVASAGAATLVVREESLERGKGDEASGDRVRSAG
jgi:hypothetical protein